MGITVEDVQDAAKVAEAISKILNLLKSLNSARSVVLEVQNLTSSPLRRLSVHHAEGGFAEPPSLEILPGQADVFGSKSSGVASGTEGRVIYESDAGFLLHVEWKNPFVGANSSEARVVGDNAAAFEAEDTPGVGQQGAHMQYIVRPGVPAGVIVRKFEGEAGHVSEIVAIRSRRRELLTAVRTESETLKLISWRVDSENFLISRNGDSGDLAKKASDIDIAQGRRFVSACRSEEGNVVLISWEITGVPGARVFHRLADSRLDGEDQAKDVGRIIKIVALPEPDKPFDALLFLTAVRTNSDKLKLICWKLVDEPQNENEKRDSLLRLGDSGDQAGVVTEISLVKVSQDADGNHRVVTSVRDSDGDLVLISWSISADGSRIRRLAFHHGQAGKADLIRSVFSSGRLVTAVRGNLKFGGPVPTGDLVLITWDIEENGTITRLADTHGPGGAGKITANALMSRPGGVLSAVNGGEGLKLIAWRITAQGGIKRTVDSGEQAGHASLIALCQEPLLLGPPIVTAVRTASDNLKLIAWTDQ